MTRKRLCLLAALALSVLGTKAQTLLSENFEDCVTIPPTEWNVVNDTQQGSHFHWELLTDDKNAISGKKCALVTSGSYTYNEPAKEEWLITPVLKLTNDSYKLEFKWVGASAAALDDKEYDFKVKVSTDDGKTWTEIWSFLNKQQVEESGVVFPWTGWAKNSSLIDLTIYKGQTIKIAFIHCKLAPGVGIGNDIKIDDIIVEKYSPILKPQIEGATSFKFEASYIGVKKYSDILTFKNIGKDTLKVNAISGMQGTDFSTTIIPSEVKLAKNAEYKYQIIYQPTLTGLKNTTIKIETNGGNLEVAVSGTKKTLPENYTLESFEGNVFPPLGWNVTGDWKAYNAGFSGDKCAEVSFSEKSDLISPRLDLQTGNYTITYDFMEQYEATSDEASGPENYFNLYFSKDGGKSWSLLDQNMTLNEIVHKEISLGTPASDNCYLKWSYYFENFDMSTGEIPEFSTVFLDDVILPPLYGRNNAPIAATNPIPANDAKDIFNKELVLSWKGVQFATGYKVYIGTQSTNFEIYNGQDVGNNTSFTIPHLDYERQYFWKVVPYNPVGEAIDILIWSFTVMPDQSIKTFPWFEGFEGNVFPPLGWRTTSEAYAKWSTTNFNPFDGNKSLVISGNTNNTNSVIQTPEVILPADKTMQICFYWGNQVPANLTKNAPATAKATESDSIYFEIYANNAWKVLAYNSDKENSKWIRERILLDNYKGQTVSFRWRYRVLNGMRSTGAGLDNITVETASLNGKPVFNKANWNAGTVNYKKSFNSKEIFTLLNDGEQALSIKSVEFKTNNFVSSLNPGVKLESREIIKFSLTFNAGTTAAAVKDTMKVTFTEGVTAILPVEGIAMSNTTRYFGFEEDTFGSTQPLGLTTVDVDGAATCRPIMINYPNYGNPYAYIVINQKPEPDGADWRNIYPRSGDQVLACMSAQVEGISVNDWIISEKMTARQSARFRFFGKSYASADQFDLSRVSVWVSTDDNIVSSFQPVEGKKDMELPHKNDGSFTEFEIDLSKYAGQSIYVALQHTVGYNGFVAFFDDFYFENFDFPAEGNSAPEFTTQPVINAYVGVPYTYSFAVNDVDGDALTFKIAGLPTWLNYTPSANGGVISGTPASKGEVLYRITASDGNLTTTQDVVLNVIDGLNIKSTESDIRIYPNPVSEVLYIDGIDNGNITLTSVTGKVVYRNKNVKSIDVSSLSSGVYLLTIQDKDMIRTTRILKK